MNSKKDFKYSVLMGLYSKDSPEFLRIAIDSMLNQTIPPEEYFIAVDEPVGEELQKILDDYSVPDRTEKELAVFEAHPEY